MFLSITYHSEKYSSPLHVIPENGAAKQTIYPVSCDESGKRQCISLLPESVNNSETTARDPE